MKSIVETKKLIHKWKVTLSILVGILITLSSSSAEAANGAKLLFLGNKNIAPVVYLDNGVTSGVAVDIIRALAQHITQPVEIKAMDWVEAQKLVARGEADALIQINETEERRKVYDFSESLLESQFSIFTTTNRVGISGISSLRGLRVGVESGGLPRQVLEKNPLIQLTIIQNFLEGFELLAKGTIDAVVVDYRVGSYIIAENKLRNIKVTGESVAFSYSSIAVKKGNVKLLAEINNALRLIKADSTYDKILDKWKPKEVVFQTREQITQKIYTAIIVVLLIVFLIAAIWTLTLKKELARRKAAEEQLKEQFSTLHGIINSVNALIFSVDRQYRYTSFNKGHADAMKSLYGTKIELGRNLLEYMTVQGDRETARCNLDRALAGEQIVEETYSGEELRSRQYFQVAYSPIKTGSGEVIGVVVHAQDLTERKLAEETLHRERALLRCIIDSASDLIFIKNREGLYLGCNKASEQFIGLQESEQIGKTDYDFFDRERASQVREDDRQVIESGKTLRTEEWVTYPDGRKVLLDTVKVPFFEPEGEIKGLVGICRDITERKQIEESLQKLSSAIEQSPVSIVITDLNGNIEFVNPKFSQLTGYSPEEAIGQNPRILKSGETPLKVYRQLWSDITSGKVWTGEFRNRKKSGEIFLEYATIAPVKNRQEEITSYIAIKEDITEHRNLESQLRQVQKMEAIGTFTGGIAHDFNNILSVIIGFGSILEMKMAKNDPLRDNVMQILTAADRASKLTQSMLAFSRRQTITVKPEELNEIISAMERMLRRIIREDIELRFCLADEALPVLADAGQVEQILLNLTTNAKDSMPTGGIITITTEPVELDESFRHAHGYGESGRYALISLTDNGTGMEDSVRQRIFEPFFTTKEVGKGTGLGLAICYGIIKQHHGFINCLSEPGKGTTFRIYLPLYQSAAVDTTAVAIENLPPRGGTETILVAEDDPAVRTLTMSILQEYGYSVIEAEDGAAAVARFAEHQNEIHLCLFDMIMPKKSGKDAYEEIREIRPDIKVLFMSGYQADSAFQQGADLISKPVLPRELLKRVRNMLDRVYG